MYQNYQLIILAERAKPKNENPILPQKIIDFYESIQCGWSFISEASVVLLSDSGIQNILISEHNTKYSYCSPSFRFAFALSSKCITLLISYELYIYQNIICTIYAHKSANTHINIKHILREYILDGKHFFRSSHHLDILHHIQSFNIS